VHAATAAVADEAPPPALDLAGYVRERVEAQMEHYYRPRSAELARSATRWRTGLAVLLFAGSGLSALAAVVPTWGLGAWVAVLTTMAGAIGAHVEAAKFDNLVISYRSTLGRLTALRDEWCDSLAERALTPAEAADFVDRCEDAISVENQAWMAEWAEDQGRRG